MQFPVILGLHRSRLLMAGFYSVFFPLMLVLMLFSRSTVEKGAFLLAMLVFGLFAWRALQPALRSLRFEDPDRLSVQPAGASQPFVRAVLLPGVTVHPWLTAGCVQTEDGRKYRFMILPDMVAARPFRHLRQLLLWGRATTVSGGGPDDGA